MSAGLPARFTEDGRTLRGFLFRAMQEGPRPAVLWSHGSERTPDSGARLSAFFNGIGYTMFTPHRRGHGDSDGEFERDLIEAEASSREDAIARVIEMHERHLADTRAAYGWLAAQDGIDSSRIVVAGASHGGIQTLLAAEGGIGARAYVAFSPAAMSWEGNPEIRARLLTAVRAAPEPILLVQAENDFSLGPSDLLGAELEAKGPPNRALVFPAFGSDRVSGHSGFVMDGAGVWGSDVRRFLDAAARDSSAAV